MMKELYIMRHAKSDWNGYYVSDFERGLNKRGQNDAPLMGEILKQRAIMPDLILSSPATRARTTAQIVAQKIGYTKEIVFDERIYEASLKTLLHLLSGVEDEVEKLMLFGHNPGLTSLVNYLTSGDLENLPTAGVVGISFSISHWSQIAQVRGEVLFFDYPKKYK